MSINKSFPYELSSSELSSVEKAPFEISEMQLSALVIALCSAFVIAVNSEKKVICYFANWATYRDPPAKYNVSKIDPTLCTHIIYSFIGLNDDASVKILDEWIDVTNNGFVDFNNLRKKSPSTKTIVAIGGWGQGSQNFSKILDLIIESFCSVANDPSKRTRFVKEIVSFLKKYDFNGLDVDWEFPGDREGSRPADKENFVHLLRELKEKLSKDELSLSAAVNSNEYYAGLSYNIREISKHLDFINLMTYDFHGGHENKVGHNAPIYASSQETPEERKLNIDHSVKFWITQGAPSEKIVLGIPFYGVSFTLADPNQHKRGSPVAGPGNPGPYTKNPGTLSYYEICQNIKSQGWQIEIDEEQHVSYAHKDKQIVGFDNVESLKEKAEFVKKHDLGGTMVWSMDSDDFEGICGEKNPLLKTLNEVLRK